MPVEKYEERLDMLAEVLECRSACVAIACVNGQFLITANEFTSNKATTEEQYNIVNQIMQYFQSVANSGSPNIDIRDNLMFDICRLRLESLGKGKLRLEEDTIRKFINSNRMAGRGKTPEISECEGLRENDVFSKVLAAYGTMHRIYKFINKIEKDIQKALVGNYASINQEQLQAFQAFQPNRDILHKAQQEREYDKPIHVELQLLINLVDNIEDIRKPVYMGISQRCCFDCNCIMEAANRVLNKTNFRINTRGDSHNVAERNFYFPEVLFKSNLLSQVKEEYYRLKMENQPSDIIGLHQHQDTASETSEDEFGKKVKYQDLLAERKKVFEQFQSKPDATIDEHLKMLHLAENLHSKGFFDVFFSINSNTETTELERIINTFLQQCRKSA